MESRKVHPAAGDGSVSGTNGSSDFHQEQQSSQQSVQKSLGKRESILHKRKWEPGKGKSVHFQDELPKTPPVDDPDAEPPAVVPEELSMFIPGYGSLSFKQGASFDVPSEPEDLAIAAGVEKEPQDFERLLTLTESEVRQSMLDYAAQKQCYGATCAKEMVITSIRPAHSFTYSLESFYETRCAMLKEIPFRGGTVDGPQNGAPPSPWEIACLPEKMFVDSTRELQVPHTSEVRECQQCRGHGSLQCYRCRGHGEVVCGFCHATGMHMHYDVEGMMRKASCSHCKGKHRITCTCCNSEGRLICSRCDGYASVKSYVLLRVIFTTETSSHSTVEESMPPRLLAEAQLVSAFEQVLPRVQLPESFPSKELVTAAQRLAKEQIRRESYTGRKLLQQRQRISAAKLVEVQYSWRGASYVCWIHGSGNAVEAPDYPQRARCSLQ